MFQPGFPNFSNLAGRYPHLTGFLNRKARYGLSGLMVCLLVFGAGLGLSGCRNDRISVDTKDSHSPQYAYRLDELAMLRLAADNIQDLERKRQYTTIYNEYASDAFKKSVDRRLFLIMSNCVETHLGGLQEFDINQIGFRRETPKDAAGRGGSSPLDVLNRQVLRARGSIEEQMVFVWSGFNFKLNSLYWITKDKQFLECIRTSAEVAASTDPNALPAAIAPESTEPPATDETPAGEQPSAEPGHAPDTPQSSEPAADNPVAPATSSGVEPAAVQQLRPTELNKKTIQAKPAGAGVVVDTRPEQPKRKDEGASGGGEAKSGTSRYAENSTAPGSDD